MIYQILLIIVIYLIINISIRNKYIDTFINFDTYIDQRVKYYMGSCYYKKIFINKYEYNKNNFKMNLGINDDLAFTKFYFVHKINYYQLNTLYFKKTFPNYVNDLNEYLLNKHDNQIFQIALGDIQNKCNYEGTLGKSRIIHDNNIILLKLNKKRHWNNLFKVRSNDLSYNLKDDKIIWRGATTGYIEYYLNNKHKNQRYNLVNKFYNHPNKSIDIGFSQIVQENKELKNYLKDGLSMKDQLKSKFIISVEGNDVATGLKWQLLSNSVVFMSKPKIESWLMEGKLIPNYHYILIKDDFSDLEEKYNWALKNEDKCVEISRNATNYMYQFLDTKRENIIINKVFDVYFKNITFEKN